MRLPQPAAWNPRLLAALLRGSLPFISSGRSQVERSAPEGFIPWRGDSFVPRERGPEAAAASGDGRPVTYAREQLSAHRSASRLTPTSEPSIFPWEELARIRGAPGTDPARGATSPPDQSSRTDTAPMNAASARPLPGDAAIAFRTTPAVSPTATTFGWTRTAVGGQRPPRAVPAPASVGAAWKWLFWITILAFTLYQL